MSSVEVIQSLESPDPLPSSKSSLLPEVEVPVASNVDEQSINYNDCDNFNFTNMQSSLTPLSSDETSNFLELHAQITKLKAENSLLKAKLYENNPATEESLREANEKILGLQKENSELRVKILKDQQGIKINKENPTVKSCEKCLTLESGLNHMLGVDYAEENEHLLFEWSNFRVNLCENLKYVCRHLEEISRNKQDNEKLLLDCYTLILKFKIAFLEGNVEENQFAPSRTDEETGFEIVSLRRHPLSLNLQLLNEELSLLVRAKDQKLLSYGRNFCEYEMKFKSQEQLLKEKSKIESRQKKEFSELRMKYKRLQVACDALEKDNTEVLRKLASYERCEKEKREELSDKEKLAEFDNDFLKKMREKLQKKKVEKASIKVALGWPLPASVRLNQNF